MAIELTEKEILLMKAWMAWQKQAAQTNTISFQIDALNQSIRDKVATMPESAEIQTLHTQHNAATTEAQALLETYKGLARDV